MDKDIITVTYQGIKREDLDKRLVEALSDSGFLLFNSGVNLRDKERALIFQDNGSFQPTEHASEFIVSNNVLEFDEIIVDGVKYKRKITEDV